jgi:Zn-dependent protease
VHPSFLLLVLLIALEESAPHALGVFDAVVWVVLIFVCVLAHELAHCVVARRKGATVRSIVLLPIGGVSQIEQMPQRWSDEFEIAAAGPLASIAGATAAGAAALATGGHVWPPALYDGSLLTRLAWLNLLLGVFNLLPAFPLDGGRVLRAWLERSRDLESATHIAARVGQVLAGLMVIVGVLWDWWLVFIGAFVYLGAKAEDRSMTVHSRLTGRTVAQFMRHPATTLDARQALGPWTGLWPGPYPVTDSGLYLGLALGSDIAAGDPRTTVADVTDTDAPALTPDEDLGGKALDELLNSGYPALAVVAEGRVVGMLLATDIAQWFESGPAATPQ